MNYLTTDAKHILCDVGVDSYLPTFGTYRTLEFLSLELGPMHLSDRCVGGELQLKKFTSVTLDGKCETCKVSPQWETFKKLTDTLTNFMGTPNILVNIDTQIEAFKLGKDSDLEDMGTLLAGLRHWVPTEIEELQRDNMLQPFADVVKGKALAAEEKLVSFFKSEEVKEVVDKFENLFEETCVWNKRCNALMFQPSRLTGYALALMEVYSQELAPGKFLAVAPSNVLLRLDKRTLSSPLNIEPDMSLEVLTTAAILWDPGAETILGDAAMALKAALELTPKT